MFNRNVWRSLIEVEERETEEKLVRLSSVTFLYLSPPAHGTHHCHPGHGIYPVSSLSAYLLSATPLRQIELHVLHPLKRVSAGSALWTHHMDWAGRNPPGRSYDGFGYMLANA
jgi:hypothetical protein